MRAHSTLSVLALLALSAAAGAQVNVYRLGIPDFDQRRAGLAGDGGMHCVPTSCMNLYAYAANHGVPNATVGFPGPRNWQSPANYNAGTQLVNLLGGFMGTTAANGTNGSGAENGMAFYNILTGGKFTSDVYWANGGFAPSPNGVSFHMLLGGLVAVCYGRYEQSPTTGVWTRGGGHCMSLVGVQDFGGEFLVRDPAADEGNVAGRLTMQSPFRTEKYTMNPVAANFRYAGQNGSNFRVQYHFVEKGVGRFLDTVMVIWPQVAITPVSLGNVPTIKFITPFSLTNEPQQIERFVQLPNPTTVHDLSLALDKAHIYFTAHHVRNDGTLYRHNRVTDEITEIIPLDNPGKMTVDRWGRIWAADGSVIKLVTDNGLLLPAVQTIVLPTDSTPDDIFFDDRTDEAHILSTSNDRLIIAIADGSVRANLRLPPGVDLQGDGSVVPSPDGTKIWLAHQADGIIRECQVAAGAPVLTLLRTISLPAVQSIRSMQFDDQGHLFISNGVDMHEFMEDAASGRWVAVPNSVWSGRGAGAAMHFGRSRTNYVPDEMGPSDVNILNGEPGNGGSFPDCEAGIVDINFDGNVDPDDLGDYINIYFAPQDRFRDGRADWNQDGNLDADDLGDYINAYFGGGCN
ncbi:MAG: hypothetical protein AB7K52_14500 [Phycisphaerales bacterium]